MNWRPTDRPTSHS